MKAIIPTLVVVISLLTASVFSADTKGDTGKYVFNALPPGEMVLVATPFSSLQLSPSVVAYLGLTATEVKAIQKLMDQERPTTESLMHELRTISGELGSAIQGRNENEGYAQRLAARQARLLKQLMTGNSRLQRRINDVLDSRQRRKLDSFRRMSEVTVGGEN
jgi:hypothetical protein